MKLKVVVWQEDDAWCASVPALPGCQTWGETYDELVDHVKDAVQSWLEVAAEIGELDPEKKLVEVSV